MAQKYAGMLARSSVYVNFYEGWNFDWSNALHVFLKVGGREKHLHFFMEKFFILTKKIPSIPILGKDGWVCL